MLETTTTREEEQAAARHPDARFSTVTADRLIIPWPGTDRRAIELGDDHGSPCVTFWDREGEIRMELDMGKNGLPEVVLYHGGNTRARIAMTEEGNAELVLGEGAASISLSAATNGKLALQMGNLDGPFVHAVVNQDEIYQSADISAYADGVTGVLLSSSTEEGRTFTSSVDLYHKEHGAARLEVDNGDPSLKIHAFGSQARAKVRVDRMGRPELVLTDASGTERVLRDGPAPAKRLTHR